MKKLKGLSELHTYVRMAKDQGIPVKSSKSAGGWIAFAKSCGAEQIHTKADARAFLRNKFQSTKPKSESFTRPSIDVKSNSFLESFQLRKLRMQALKKYGPKCMCCGATPATGAVMNVDHIKPRKLFPALAMDLNNLQVLCHECNHGKGNWDQTDWRVTS
jgi:5-methylcytosine-specific restriction endonuclease McrA